MFDVKYIDEPEGSRWPSTRGNHTDAEAIERVNGLPECIREHMWTNDPCWSYIPDGWVGIIERLHENLVLVAPEYRITQVKEKFGGLRFYTNIGYDPDGIASMIIQHYERESEVTCDVCGERGKIVDVGEGKMPYVASRCEEHYVEKRARART